MKIQKSQEYIVEMARKTVPSMRYDGIEDYTVWKRRATDKLYDLLGLPFEYCNNLFEIVSREDCSDYTRIDFTFQSEEGYFVPAAFLIPKGKTFPRKTAICIQGHTTGMHVSVGIEKFPSDYRSIPHSDFARQAIKEGYCVAMLEQRYMGVCGQNELGIPACPTKNAALPALLMGRTAIGERVWDVQKLIDVLEQYFAEYIDMEELICLGNSGGGTATFYAACVDDRIKLAIPSCSVCEFEDSIIPIHHCCCNYIPGIRKYFEMGDMAGLMADRKLIIVCGIQDADFPIAGVEKSYERAKGVFRQIGREDYCRIVKGPEGHQFYPLLAWPVVKELASMK